MRSPFRRAAAFALTLAAPLALGVRPAPAAAMVVPLNHAERINLGGAAASVIIGNNEILAVTVVDSHTVYVMGKKAGATNVTILDRTGQPIFASEMTVASAGSNVTLYRGDKRVTVNCASGCVESDAPAGPGAGLGGGGSGPAAGATTAAAVQPIKLMP
jgi:Flp pilus assembly secretin CpaC